MPANGVLNITKYKNLYHLFILNELNIIYFYFRRNQKISNLKQKKEKDNLKIKESEMKIT